MQEKYFDNLDYHKASADDLLNILNQCLYAYVEAENKQEEKQQYKNIKLLKKALKKVFKKKIKFDKQSMLFTFKKR